MSRLMLVFADAECGYGAPKYPPLAFALLASVCKDDEVVVYDERSMHRKFFDVVEEFHPDFVGFHCTILNAPNAKKLHDKLKKAYPNIKTIAGGPQVSANPEEFEAFDFVVRGEGEVVLPKILDGTFEEKFINASLINDLDSLPFPDWGVFGEKFKFLPVMATRGCPYGCIFCNVHKTFGKKHRSRSPENVIAEIKHDVENYGLEHFEIIDDNFTVNPEYVKKFCNLLLDADLHLTWDCIQGARIDRLDEEALTLMKKSGCRVVAVGIESGNQKIVDGLKKGLNLEVARKNIALAKKVGLRVKCFFLVGSPGETYDDVLTSIKFFKDNKVDMPRFGILSPYPDTELWTWSRENSKVLIHNIGEYTHGAIYDHWSVAYETEEFPKEKRLEAIKLATTEAEIWTIRMRFGRIIGAIARIKFIRNLATKLYFSSNFLKRRMWN